VEVAGVEKAFRLPLTVDGVDLTLAGKADRLERLPDGRVRVIDFKTSKVPISTKDAEQFEQLGVYQLAVDAGVLDDGTGRAAGSAGAALVFLREPRASGLPTERTQSAVDAGTAWVRERLAQVAAIVREGTYPATPGRACDRCSFGTSCPAHDQGGQVIS